MSQTPPAGPGQPGPEPSAYDLAFMYSLGRITREELINRLATWSYVPDERRVDGDDTPVPPPLGTFGESVGRAFDDDLIDAAIYEEILDRVSDDREGK